MLITIFIFIIFNNFSLPFKWYFLMHNECINYLKMWKWSFSSFEYTFQYTIQSHQHSIPKFAFNLIFRNTLFSSQFFASAFLFLSVYLSLYFFSFVEILRLSKSVFVPLGHIILALGQILKMRLERVASAYFSN